MTRSEEILRFNKWADLNLLRRGEREKCIDYIYDTYTDGFEVVKRGGETMNKEEARIFLSGLVAKRELGRLYADLFTEAIYEEGYEIVDRKLDDATIEKQMDESDDYLRRLDADVAKLPPSPKKDYTSPIDGTDTRR